MVNDGQPDENSRIHIFVVDSYVNGTNNNNGTDFGGLCARSVKIAN